MIPLYSSFIRRKDMDAVLSCLVTDSVGPGDYTLKFMKTAREAFGFESVAALRSPYLALTEIIRRLGLPDGAAIAISPLAPIFHKAAVEDMGYVPLYYDHDLGTLDFVISDNGVQGASALILYEPFGLLPDISVVATRGLPLVEDISQSLGASRSGATAGHLGGVAFYGLEQGAVVTAGGGAVVLAASRREGTIVRELSETVAKELALTDFNAALGLAQLKEMPDAVQKRRRLREAFLTELGKTRHRALRREEDDPGSPMAFPVLLESGMRDVIVHAKRNGVEAAPAFEGSIVSEEGFSAACPGARALALRCVVFPLHDKISAQDAKLIGKVLATLP